MDSPVKCNECGATIIVHDGKEMCPNGCWEKRLKPSQLNTQPIEKPDFDQRGLISVQDIFHTIQGEGPFQGKPAIFIRMAGCNLQCPNCDTDYTSNRRLMNPMQVVGKCQEIAKGCLVVITGGEPMRQNMVPITKHLILAGYQIQIETNGTIWQPLQFGKVIICCSPKTGALAEKLLEHIDYYKYILDARYVDPTDGLPTSTLGNGVKPARPHNDEVEVYIQPEDAQNEEQTTANVSAAVQSTMRFNYRISLQLHKILGMP